MTREGPFPAREGTFGRKVTGRQTALASSAVTAGRREAMTFFARERGLVTVSYTHLTLPTN